MIFVHQAQKMQRQQQQSQRHRVNLLLITSICLDLRKFILRLYLFVGSVCILFSFFLQMLLVVDFRSHKSSEKNNLPFFYKKNEKIKTLF
jgi:uncharacterized membrane protein